MLNYELARVVAAERARLTDEQVRQGRLRRELAEGKVAAGRALQGSPDGRSCPDPSQRPSPALG